MTNLFNMRPSTNYGTIAKFLPPNSDPVTFRLQRKLEVMIIG